MTLIYNTKESDSFWVCYKCGYDIPFIENMNLRHVKYDAYWTRGDEEAILLQDW